jgi:hypothetical protein
MAAPREAPRAGFAPPLLPLLRATWRSRDAGAAGAAAGATGAGSLRAAHAAALAALLRDAALSRDWPRAAGAWSDSSHAQQPAVFRGA